MKINYKSDFKLHEVSDTVDLITPFRFTYKTTGVGSYIASFDGENYTNCRRLDDGSLLVIFNKHKLNSGRLRVLREYFLDDNDFNDNIYNFISEDNLEVTLTSNHSYSSEDITIEVYPGYQKGDSGTTELMSFEIKDDGCLYVSQPTDSNLEFNINSNGELIISWQ